MIRSPVFWDYEKTATLLQLNSKFLSPEEFREDVYRQWPEYLGLDPERISLPEDYPRITKDQNDARIFELDAIRTFRHPENRDRLVKLLNHLSMELGSYHQGLNFVASILLLLFEEKYVVAMVKELGTNPKYVPGYWREPAVPFVTDAYVFDELLKKHRPEIHAHFLKIYLVPNMYATKWFVGFCVHVLHFPSLFRFIENVFKHGYPYIFGFALELVSQLETRLLAAKDASVALEILKLEPKRVKEEEAASIVDGGLNWLPILQDIDWETLRKDTFETHLRERLEKAERDRLERERLAAEEDDEDNEDDEDEDEDDEDDEEDKEEDSKEVDELTKKVSKVSV